MQARNKKSALRGKYIRDDEDFKAATEAWLEGSDPKCKLIQNLTESYWKDLLLGCSGSGRPVDVAMQLLLRQLVELDEPREILTTNVWLRIKWNDCRLRWNPADYNGIDILYLPFGSIWAPDVTHYDDSAFGSNLALSERKSFILEVYSTGQVRQKFPTLLQSICGVDTTKFPYDKQTCPLTFGPWVYDSSAVNLTTYIEDRNEYIYIENDEWLLNGIKTETSIAHYTNQLFTEVIFHVEIERRPTFFMLTLFFPCTFISYMGTIGFLMPLSSRKQVEFHLTLLLSLTVFQFVTLGLVPPNSKPPLMCEYFAVLMVLAGLSCLLSVLVMKIHSMEEGGWKASEKVQKRLKTLRCLLLVKNQCNKKEDLSKDAKRNDSTSTAKHLIGLEIPSQRMQGHRSNEKKSNDSTSNQTESQTRDAATNSASEDAGSKKEDSVTMAPIIDRLFLIFYICLSVIVTIVFLSALTS